MSKVAKSILLLFALCTAAMGQVAAEPTTLAVTARQQQWLQASLEQRKVIAEALGEEGAEAFARAKGYKPLLTKAEKVLRQGLDQVYQTSDEMLVVIEAKGGSGQLTPAYGHPQGSSEWAVKAAERMAKSSKATAAEREVAEAVLKAAAKGKLLIQVVRTDHVLGEPVKAVLEQSTKCTDEATKLAKEALDELSKHAAASAKAAASTTDDAARTAEQVASGGESLVPGSGSTAKTALRWATKCAVVLGFAVDAGFRVRDGIETERRYTSGEISLKERETKHAKIALGMLGGWGGAALGGKLGAMGGGAAGSAVAPGLGTVTGAIIGGVAGGVTGYIGGEKAAEHVAEWAVTKVHDAGSSVSAVADKAWTGTKAAAYTAGDYCKSAGGAVKSGCGKAVSWCSNVYHWVRD